MVRTLGCAVWLLDLSKSHCLNSHARCSLFGGMPSRDQKVESALILAWSTIPAASSVPFLTIPALLEWTPSDITEGDLVEYAGRHEQGTSTEDAVRRGVVVQVVHHKGTMAKHHVFVLFSPNSAVPRCDAPFRSRFYALKRHVADLWYVDQHELSSKLLHRPHIEHKNTATYGPSLAFEFLGSSSASPSRRAPRGPTERRGRRCSARWAWSCRSAMSRC